MGLKDCTPEEQFGKELKVTEHQWSEAFINSFTQVKVVFDLYLRV